MDTHATLNEEDEVIPIIEPNITFIVDDATFGKGSLYVADSKLFWKNDINNQIVSVEYESMCIFGTCNHSTVHEKPCMLIIVDFTYKPDNVQCENGLRQNGVNHENIQDNEEINDSDDNEDSEDDEEEMKSKIKLVPDNPNCLTEIYEAFARNQSRHSRNEMSSEDEGDAFYNENDEFEDNEENGDQMNTN